jgi:hypothetical protein
MSECLPVYSLADVPLAIETCMHDYTQRRLLHSSLDHLTPNEFVAQGQAITSDEEVCCG